MLSSPHPREQCASALRSFTKLEVKITVAITVDAGVFPTVGVVTDVPESHGRVGDDGNSTQSRSMTECEIFRQVPVPGFPGTGLVRRMNALRSRSDHWKKERPHRAVRVFVADREVELLDHRLIDGSAHMQESCSAVEQFVQPPMNSEAKAGSARQNMNRQFSFALFG